MSSIHDRHIVLSPHLLVRTGSGETLALLAELWHFQKRDLTLSCLENVPRGGPPNFLTDLKENYRSEVPEKCTLIAWHKFEES
jgi:hypothetical protein